MAEAGFLVPAVPQVAAMFQRVQLGQRPQSLHTDRQIIGCVLAGVIEHRDLLHIAPDTRSDAVQHAGKGCNGVIGDDQDPDTFPAAIGNFGVVCRHSATQSREWLPSEAGAVGLSRFEIPGYGCVHEMLCGEAPDRTKMTACESE